jgi:hypothetical protein
MKTTTTEEAHAGNSGQWRNLADEVIKIVLSLQNILRVLTVQAQKAKLRQPAKRYV